MRGSNFKNSLLCSKLQVLFSFSSLVLFEVLSTMKKKLTFERKKKKNNNNNKMIMSEFRNLECEAKTTSSFKNFIPIFKLIFDLPSFNILIGFLVLGFEARITSSRNRLLLKLTCRCFRSLKAVNHPANSGGLQ